MRKLKDFKNLTLVNIFGPRRGSTFVFNYLKQHPEISYTKEKNFLSSRKPQSNFNADNFKLNTVGFNEKTKIVLDGTDSLIWTDNFFNIKKFIKDLGVKDMKFIYLFRDPYIVLKSKILYFLVKGGTVDSFSVDDIVNGVYEFESTKILKRIKDQFPRKNIFIICIEDFADKINELYDFLSISHYDLNTENVFKYDKWYLLEQNPEVANDYYEKCKLITPDNPNLSWVYDDYKAVDDEYGTNLVEKYNLKP